MIELADATKTVTPAVVACMKRIPEDRRCSFLYYILTDYLHLANVGKQYRRYLAITVAQLIQQNYISVEHFTLAYNEFSEYANDLIVDIPELWLYILQFTGNLYRNLFYSVICDPNLPEYLKIKYQSLGRLLPTLSNRFIYLLFVRKRKSDKPYKLLVK